MLKMDVHHKKPYFYIPATAMFAKVGILFVIFSFSEAQFSSFLQVPQTPQRVSPLISTGSTTSRGLMYRQREILNASTDTILEWEVNPLRSPNSTITFQFSTSISSDNDNRITLLGLSKTGLVDGADVVAVFPSAATGGLPQLVDMYGMNNSTIVPDSVQNWRLVASNQNSSHVSFTVSRILDTCDEHDVAINNDLLRIIWGYTEANIGRNGSLSFTPEGSVRGYLLDPVVSNPAGSARVQSWRLSRQFHVPPRHTSYWCTIHRGLPLTRKHHVVGFTPYFKDELSRQHVHHKLVYRCIAPPGIDPANIFEKFVGHPGEECYLEEKHELPTIFCTEILMSWGVGGQSFNFPNDVGLALGDTRNEYFMFEAHYDNPEVRSDLVVENGVDLAYTPDLRPQEGSIIFVATGIFGMYQVPPHTENFRIAGQCSKECTLQMIPPSGVEIIAANLHSHRTTRKMIVRHFRGNRELPWIQSDLNYDFNYQQKRLLPNRVTVRAGDHLAVECQMDSRSRNATTLSGFATRDEMCMSFIVLNKRLPYTYCTSEYLTDVTMAKYGITNMTWTREGQERVVNAARNPRFIGLPVSRVIDEIEGNWTPAKVRALEREQLYGEHESTCPSTRLLAMIAYIYQSVDDLTLGILPGRDQVEQDRPSTRSISSRLEYWSIKVRYPNNSTTIIYPPPETCAK